MSITGGNLINKLALNLHYRVVFLQLSRKSGGVLKCSNGKGYSSSSSSSVPVRYIPKKSTRTENTDITSPSRSCNKNQNSSCNDAPQNGMLSSSDGHVEDRKNTDGSKSSGREDGVGGQKQWSYFYIDLNSGSGDKNFDHLGVAASTSVEGTRGVSKNEDLASSGDRDQLGVVQRGVSIINASNMFRHETLHDKQNAQNNFVYGKNSNIRSQKSSEIDVQVGVSTCEFEKGTEGFVKDVDVAYGGDEEQQEASTRGGMSSSMSVSKMSKHETIPEELNAPKHHFVSKSSNAISQKSSDTSPVDKTVWTKEINGHLRVATSKLVKEPKKVVEDGGGQIQSQCEISCDTRGLDGRMVSRNKDFRRSEKKSSNISGSVRQDLDEQTSHSLKDMNEVSDHVVLVDTGFMEELEEDIENLGAFNHTEDCKSPAYRKTKQDVENMVVRFLAKRAFTAVELRKKLIAKSFPLAVVENVIHDFQKRGLINDRLYAETYSQSRWSTSSWGPRKIKQELGMKGINQADVTRAVKLVFEDDESSGETSRINLSKSSLERLYAQAYKKWLQCQNVPWEKRKARIINWLQYRGFNWDVVSIILKKLESQRSP